MRMTRFLAGSCATALALAGAAAWAEVTPERLLNAGTEAEAGNWLMVAKTYDSNRFSTLNEINASNVAGLRVITAAPIGGTEPAGFGVGSVEGTPLADPVAAPTLGQHTDQVLREVLGYDATRIAALRDAGVIAG